MSEFFSHLCSILFIAKMPSKWNVVNSIGKWKGV